MNEQQEREAFVKWRDDYTEKYFDEYGECPKMTGAWLAWQARAALPFGPSENCVNNLIDTLNKLADVLGVERGNGELLIQAAKVTARAALSSAPAGEPVHWRAVLDPAQVPHELRPDRHCVGFRNKRSAEQWIAERLDFDGWRYSLEPLFTAPEPPAAKQPSVAFRYRDEQVARGMQGFYDAYGIPAPEQRSAATAGVKQVAEREQLVDAIREFAKNSTDDIPDSLWALILSATKRPAERVPLSAKQIRDEYYRLDKHESERFRFRRHVFESGVRFAEAKQGIV